MPAPSSLQPDAAAVAARPLGADDTRGVEQDVDTLHSSLKMLQEQARSTIWRALSNALPPRAMQLLSRDVVTHL